MDMHETATNAVVGYLAGTITQERLAQSCYPLVKRAAKIAAARVGVDSDDAAQELWLLFVDKVVHRYQADRPLFPFLVEFARRHCLSMLGDNRELLFSDLGPESDDDRQTGGHWLLDEALVDQGLDLEVLDRQKAEYEFMRLVSAGKENVVLSSDRVYHSESESVSSNCENGRTEMEARLPGVQDFTVEKYPEITEQLALTRPKRVRTFKLTSEQEELRNIRLKLRMTKEIFAEHLGIKQSTLDSYEYGKTQSVPENVMEAARRLAENSTDELADARDKFDAMSMSDILEMWAKRLGVPPENATLLGQMLGTTATTIRRWRANAVRPDLAKIAALDSQVSVGPQAAGMFTAKEAVIRLRSESPETKGAVFIFANLLKGAMAALSKIKAPTKETQKAIAELQDASEKAHRITLDTGEYLSMDATLFGNITRRLIDSLEI